MTRDHSSNRLVIFNGISHISMQKLPQPYKNTVHKMVCRALMLSLLPVQQPPRRVVPATFQADSRHAHDRIIDHGNAEQNRNCDQDTFDNIFRHNIPHSWMKNVCYAVSVPS